jgi:hypothetical protein
MSLLHLWVFVACSRVTFTFTFTKKTLRWAELRSLANYLEEFTVLEVNSAAERTLLVQSTKSEGENDGFKIIR